MAKYYIIYETKNLKNGKLYIGMHRTNNLNDDYLGSGKALKRAIRYYGKEFFERRILHVFDNQEDMIAKEIELVNEEFVQRKDTYNLTTGGEGGLISEEQQLRRAIAASKAFSDKMKNDAEFAKRHSERSSKTMKKMHEEGKIKYDTFTGKKHSEDTKKRISNTMKNKQSGKNNSQYGKCWITNGIENKKIFKDEPIPDGWKLGRKIKQAP